jgi:alpha-N-arabinofuranosidase
MLVNVNPGGMQWESDLIGYDAAKSYGSPSYYAQVMFGSYLGDHTLASNVEGAGEKFFYSITGSAAKKKLYLKLVNAESTPRVVDIDFAGTKVSTSAKLVSMAGKSTQATNSIDEPKAVAPVDGTVTLQGGKLHHTIPGYSIQVIEVTQQ